jgi:hypothetical protein
MADFQAGALLDSLTRSDQRVCACGGEDRPHATLAYEALPLSPEA